MAEPGALMPCCGVPSQSSGEIPTRDTVVAKETSGHACPWLIRSMNIWTSILLIWVGVNVLLVGLVWRYEWMKARAASRLHEGGHAGSSNMPSAPEDLRHTRLGSGIDRSRPQRIVAMAAGAAGAAPASASTGAGLPPRPASLPCGGPPHRLCRLHEMHEEIRVLKLTVAELALDKAMLSAAAAHKRALP